MTELIQQVVPMSNDFAQFLEIGIVGAFVSFLVQYLKAKFGTDSDANRVIAIVLSVVAASVYFFLQDTVYWKSLVSILGFATTFHALFLRK